MDDCQRISGRYIHHIPSSGADEKEQAELQEPFVNTWVAYESAFKEPYHETIGAALLNRWQDPKAAAVEPSEADYWNQALTSGSPAFNTGHNTFLASMIHNRPAGKALDAGMGQGRNAVYLAQQGWDVTGFDPAKEAVAYAMRKATVSKVEIEARASAAASFEWGEEQWDLIAALYVPLREFLPRMARSLKPGGIVVAEAAHSDRADADTFGEAVVFSGNELLRMFDGFRILHYEDTMAVSDYGIRTTPTRVVRLCAQREA